MMQADRALLHAINKTSVKHLEKGRGVAYRRAQKARMRAKVRRIAKSCWDTRLEFWRSGQDRANWLKSCELLADNLAHCAKPCCNKRRFYEGPPIQERRWADIGHFNG